MVIVTNDGAILGAAGVNGPEEQPAVQQCYSCKVISDVMPFPLAGYMIYHTVKNRRKVVGWERTKLYIVNGLFTASKCFFVDSF